MELKPKQYRAVMADRMYQAQFKCVACGNWVLTSNLETFKNEDGDRLADAVNVMCQQTGCGENYDEVVFLDWPYSAPVKSRNSKKRSKDKG